MNNIPTNFIRSRILNAFGLCLLLFTCPTSVHAQVDYKTHSWRLHKEEGYYYKKVLFPEGGYQYLIYYKDRNPSWVYWFNPTTQVFWCACPTKYHPKWGKDVRAGKDLFLKATTKASKITETKFPSDPNTQEFEQNPKVKDKDGSEVTLTCPDPDDFP